MKFAVAPPPCSLALHSTHHEGHRRVKPEALDSDASQETRMWNRRLEINSTEHAAFPIAQVHRCVLC
ncbi:unnamed protein product [Urochloa humidicola]